MGRGLDSYYFELTKNALERLTSKGGASTWYSAARVLAEMKQMISREEKVDGQYVDLTFAGQGFATPKLERLVGANGAERILVERGIGINGQMKVYRAKIKAKHP